MSKINVDNLADEVFDDIIGRYEKEWKQISENVLKKDHPTQADLLGRHLDILRQHNERFTSRLIQRVVDELQKD